MAVSLRKLASDSIIANFWKSRKSPSNMKFPSEIPTKSKYTQQHTLTFTVYNLDLLPGSENALHSHQFYSPPFPFNLGHIWCLSKCREGHWDNNILEIKHWWCFILHADISVTSRNGRPTVDYEKKKYQMRGGHIQEYNSILSTKG